LVKDDISGGNTGMQKRESIDYKIRGTYASLRKSEKKVVDYVLANEMECRIRGA
jgi:hypothetical protein